MILFIFELFANVKRFFFFFFFTLNFHQGI